MCSNVRIISRLDIKGPNLIKGVHLEGLRVVGNPNEFAYNYYEEGADELIFMDAVASLYGRNQLREIIEQATENIFVPLTVGGGIRNVSDAAAVLRSGADKVAVNTAAVTNPSLLVELAENFGSQSLVLSVEAKKISHGNWEILTDGGRERTGIMVEDWVVKAAQNGVGEILVTSVDQEGTMRGFDVDLVKRVTQLVDIPVIASGGMGSAKDFVDVVRLGGADAVAAARVLHYKEMTIDEIRQAGVDAGIKSRNFAKK